MIIDREMLDSLSAEAKASARSRKNRNFHAADASPCNRLLNAIEPDSYVQPHRHSDPEKGETILLLRGKLGVLFFSEAGEIVMQRLLDPEAGIYGINVPFGTIHTVLALVPGTVFFEAKSGPYVPISDAEKVDWAPREGDPGVPAYLEMMRSRFA
ncbi:MAG: WbuC family cupin fold metalloprotein [Burkholderiales bacterium]|nr:WbuC family cupin fold metalloprotein [Burkholderiales bacterium]